MNFGSGRRTDGARASERKLSALETTLPLQRPPIPEGHLEAPEGLSLTATIFL